MDAPFGGPPLPADQYPLITPHPLIGGPIYKDFGIHWYGFAYLAGIALGAWLIWRWAIRRRAPLTPAEATGDFPLVVGLSMIVGGRLGFCLFYGIHDLLRDPLMVFRVWEGGMASHGGIIGLFVGCWWFARSRRRSLLALCDVVCAVAPIGVICGRIANFVNGELWGRPIEHHVPWAFRFPLADGGAFARHPSQLYGVIAEGLFPLLLILPIHARHRRPGVTMGVLLVLYGVGRFVDEFFREPDKVQPLKMGWMNEGQVLTIPLILIGAGIAVWAWSRGPRPQAYLLPPDQTAPPPATPATA